MKRGPSRAWPKGIVEVGARRPDPRADPQATQKISREELEEALKRTKSGTRPVVRSEPNLDDEAYAGPRDDSPQVTIVRIDSMELDLIDPSTLPAPSTMPSALATTAMMPPASMPAAAFGPNATPSTTMPVIITTPMDVAAALARPVSPAQIAPQMVSPPPAGVVKRGRAPTQRLHLTPRLAFITGLVVAALIAVAALVGFFAGRGVPGVR